MNRGLIGGIGGAVVLAGLAAWGWTSGHIPLMMGDPRAIDFRSASVEVFGTACADSTLTSAAVPNVTLKDGSYDLGQYHFELMGEPKYGDVSGQTNEDSGDKAVFVGTCNQSGQTSQVLFVYGVEHSRPVRLATTDLSNGSASLVQSYSVANGTIQVKQNQGDPPQLTTVSYVLLNGELKNVGGGAAPATTPTAASPPTADANSNNVDTVSLQYFSDHLTRYGEWIDHPRWGKVWHPTAVPADFQPYRDGHWENTSDYGMVWMSNEEFGDIVYHYGRWVYDPDDAWVWVPGYVWAPSWVVWRADDSNIGWFPMPPGSYDGEGDYPDLYADWYGYRDWYGAAFDEAAFIGMWSFVGAADLFADNVDTVVIGRDRVRGFMGRTRNWTHYAVERGRVVDRAFEPHRFAATFHRPLPVSAAGHFRGHGPMASVAAGHRAADHERSNPTHLATSRVSHSGAASGLGHRAGRLGSAGAGHAGAMGRGFGGERRGHSTAFGRSGGYGGYGHSSLGHSAGFGRSSGFGRSAAYGSATGTAHSGFGRSGTGIGKTGFGPAGHSSGLARSSGGGSSGFGRTGGGGSGGFGRSTGSGGFGHSSGNAFGGGGFGNHSGGLGNAQHASAPHFSNSGGNHGGGHHK